MIIDAKKQCTSDIFSPKKAIMYRIPKYQRAYTWKRKDWDLLFNDIADNESGYFLGSMICVRSGEAKLFEDNNISELIDGQQRATSLSMLLLALYKKLELCSHLLDEDDQLDISTIKKELCQKNKDDVNEAKLCLQIQDSNRDDYNALLSEQGIISGYSKTPNAGNRKIFKAYNHFAYLIDNYLSEFENDPDKAKALYKLYKKVDNAQIVMIEVSSYSDAFMLFESLNFRGEKLTAIDLIKNSLLAEAEKNNEPDQPDDDNLNETDRCYNEWLEIQRCLGDEYAPQERFFRQFYNAFRDELNKPFQTMDGPIYPLAYKATKSTIMNIYESLIKKDYQKILKEIKDAAKRYEIITNRNKEEVSSGYAKKLLNLERIQGAPAYMFLLYLELNRERLQLDDDYLADITHALVLFFVRRNVTDFPNTRNLDKIFMDLIQQVKPLTGENVVRKTRDYLIAQSSSDKIFEEKLRGSLYEENDAATRFILCYIEEAHQTKEIFTHLWQRDDDNKYIWTIEHIFPEGENIPDCWVRMINGKKDDEEITIIDRDNASRLRKEYTHTLGNLTITGYNSNLSNMSFEKKKNRKNNRGNEIGYRNGLYLNKDIVNEDSWSISKIEKRTDDLVKESLDLFKY